MKELDLLLEGWLATRFDSAGDADRALFASLLALPDLELAQVLFEGEPAPEPGLAALVSAIRGSWGYYVR